MPDTTIKKKKCEEPHKPGKCPVCGLQGLQYDESGLDGDGYFFEWYCGCGAHGIEWYRLEFTEHYVKEGQAFP